ncbi:TIM-barrel domain-containing protein [Novosphingobium sp.]|uniref:glycoside hydrolase family 31 protein n=1 Tax=Novosphingobium sp. TaxID=1874826 RepID=UPI00333EB5A4
MAGLATTPAHAAPAPVAATAAPADAVLSVRANGATMRVTAISEAIVRVTITRDGAPAEDASWAVPADVRSARAPAQIAGTTLTTAQLRATIDPVTLHLRVEDHDGRTIVDDTANPISFDRDGFTLRKAMPQAEHYFGLGDKTGDMDRRGGSFVNWNTDAFGYQSSTDPIYKAIPFFIGVGGAGGSYGVFLDNTWRSWFDFGHREEGVLAFGSVAGPITYYVIAGPTTRDVVRRYTDLTGKSPLMPRWVLGYQQSRWGYKTADQVMDIAYHLRADKIPADVIWMDIDYQDRNRPFTVDTKAFPDLAKLTARAGDLGIKLVSIVDLHIAAAPAQGYAPYDQGMAANHFVHNPDGSVYVAPVWPGPAVFPDFTTTATRTWFGAQFKSLAGMGIAGFWNDMNEPAVFETPTKTMPIDTVHRIDGDGFAPRTATHAEIHNVYGMENTRATYDGVRLLRPDERAFVLTRASYAGGQKYAATWTGDNSSSWDHLKLSVSQLVNLGLSGFAYSGSDVGGFTGGPAPELLTKWFEIAAFTPFFRDHAANDAPRAEPWIDGEDQLAIRRRFVEARYRLLPYLYNLAAHNAQTGDPIMRPVFYDYPAALSAPCKTALTFTLGDKLLIAGNPRPDSPQAYDICLPAGGWYDYWTGERVTAEPIGGRTYAQIKATPRLDTLPVYVRAGAIVPRQPLVQSTAQVPTGPLELHIYPGGTCAGELYDDDGHSMQFTGGAFVRQTVRCTTGANGVQSISFDARQGRFKPWWKAIALVIHGTQTPATIRVNGKTITPTPVGDDRAPGFVIPDQPAAVTITAMPG